MSLWTQYLTVFAMSASGAVLGAVYDVYRTILSEWKYLRWMGSILDFVFWIFALGLTLWALHWANDGDVRLYVFLLLGIGLVLYRLWFRKLVVGSTVRIVLALTYAMKMIYRFFLVAVVGPLLWLWRFTLVLLRVIDRTATVFENIILWPFGPLLRAVAWIGRLLYRWTVRPLVHPVIRPLRKFFADVKGKWQGLLSRVAKWLVDSNEDDDNKPK